MPAGATATLCGDHTQAMTAALPDQLDTKQPRRWQAHYTDFVFTHLGHSATPQRGHWRRRLPAPVVCGSKGRARPHLA